MTGDLHLVSVQQGCGLWPEPDAVDQHLRLLFGDANRHLSVRQALEQRVTRGDAGTGQHDLRGWIAPDHRITGGNRVSLAVDFEIRHAVCPSRPLRRQ